MTQPYLTITHTQALHHIDTHALLRELWYTTTHTNTRTVNTNRDAYDARQLEILTVPHSRWEGADMHAKSESLELLTRLQQVVGGY